MENLAKVFVYLVALSWTGTEALLLASEGFPLPLAAAIVLFSVGFVIVGCYPLEDRTIDRAGQIFFSLAAFACLIFAIRTLSTAPAVGVLKIVGAAFLCLFVLRPPAARPDASGH